jgi:hypothetical protein
VGIDVSLDLSPGTNAPPLQLMYLYDDLDGDGFYTDLISAYSTPYYTKTGSSGTKVLMVRYDLGSSAAGSCTYGGNLNVISGPAFGSAHIELKEGT